MNSAYTRIAKAYEAPFAWLSHQIVYFKTFVSSESQESSLIM